VEGKATRSNHDIDGLIQPVVLVQQLSSEVCRVKELKTRKQALIGILEKF